MLRLFLFLFFAPLFFATCVSEVPVNIESPKKVVLNCILQLQQEQSLTLTFSKEIGSGIYFDPVQEADIQLFKNDTVIGSFVSSGSRTWKIDHFPKIGSVYRLDVKIPGYNKITTTTQMPDTSIVTIKKESATKMFVAQNNQQNIQWVFALNGNLDSRWEDPFKVPEIDQSDALIENIGTDHPNPDRFNQYGSLSDIIQNASLPAYEFYIRLNPTTDLANFNIEAAFAPECFVVFRNASLEYDQYMKSSFQKMQVYKDETDPAQWFDENIVYSNIENGTGIFGAYVDKVFVFGHSLAP